jgi:hypothetical protein
MSLRQGVTAAEETKLKTLASKGAKWADIVERCQTKDDRGNEQVPLLADVDLKAVKPIYDQLLKKHEEAVAAKHPDILSHERAIASKKAAALAAKKAAQEAKE